MLKKGAATLISWVLMVGLTITLAGLVINWAIQNVEKFRPEESNAADLYCPRVAIDIFFNDTSTTFNSLVLHNRGSYSLIQVRVRALDGTSEAVSIIPKLKPGEIINLTDLPYSAWESGVELIPIINIAEMDVICNEKRYKIK